MFTFYISSYIRNMNTFDNLSYETKTDYVKTHYYSSKK